MSAIFGLVRTDGGLISTQNLSAPRKVVAHYGRDGGGQWSDDRSVALGCCHRALWRNAGGETPLTLKGCTIVADVRIDNRAELGLGLGLSQQEQQEISDTLLVLHAYWQWGEDCAARLIGDFAFAIWDEAAKRLYGARDHIGVRPFYYRQDSASFGFASDIRAVLAFSTVPARINEAEVARMLLSESPVYYDNEHTLLERVAKLPFGHWLSVGPDGLRVHRYWRPEDVKPLTLPSVEAYADRLRTLVRQAVDDRLRTDALVGTHLSGGLDSCSISVLTARALRERGAPPPAVFSWSLPPDQCGGQEYRRIEAVSRQEGLAPIYAGVVDQTLRAALEAEDPATRPVNSLETERQVQRLAEAGSVGLMLSGWGGDDAASFNGRGLLAEYLQKGRWRSAVNYFAPLTRLRHPRSLGAVPAILWRQGILPLLGDRFHIWRDTRRRGPAFIRLEFLARVQERLRPTHRQPRTVPDGRKCQWRLYYDGFISARMESWTSFGMDHGLTYAYPLTDRRVLEFIYAIPVNLHSRHGQARFLYREAMRSVLPVGLVDQNMKLDTGLFLWMGERRRRRFEQWAAELARGNQPAANPWVDLPRLAAAMRSIGPTTPPHRTIPLGHARRALVLWRHWMQTRLDSCTATIHQDHKFLEP